MKYMHVCAFALCFGLATIGCDDGSNSDGEGAGGSGGNVPTDMGMGGTGGSAEGGEFAFKFTELQVVEPSPVAGVLTLLLNNSLNDGSIILIAQLQNWNGRAPTISGGAALLTMGAETADDPTDDRFEWLTEGECNDAENMLIPCEFEVATSNLTRMDDSFETEKGGLNIYSAQLAAVIRIKQMILTGSHDEIEMKLHMVGVITESDAASMRFEPAPGSGNFVDLKSFLGTVGVMPDQMAPDGAGGMEPAYTFIGDATAAAVILE